MFVVSMQVIGPCSLNTFRNREGWDEIYVCLH